MSPIMKIKKRNGDIVEFNQGKITEAIWKAAQAVGGKDKEMATQISNQVAAVLEVFFKDEANVPSVEQIQDLAEKILIEGGHAKTAKSFILYREKHKTIRNTQEDILNGHTTSLPFSLNALRILAARYLQRDDEGEIAESPEGMFSRVANALANVESNYGKDQAEISKLEGDFTKMLQDFEFIPAGRTLANAGGKTRLVSNCIVLHFEDSMEGIFQTLKDAALLQQAGSGLGFAWHLLRPAGQRTNKTQGTSSGPVSFLKAYNQSFGVIKQQGRHGANMGVMRIDHPDVLEFIESKWEEGSIANFNISIAMTDEFMEAVQSGSKEPWMCEWKGEKMKPRTIIRNNRDAFVEAVEETITATELMDKIINAAWRNGEPGVLFPDAANRSNPVPELGRLEATNPCGEQWLHDGDVCNLGSINLSKFVKDGEVDEERLREVTALSTRLLDNVIDLSDFPVEKVNAAFRNNRRIGLGIMGFADMLYQLRIPYNSQKGFEIGEKVMGIVNDQSHKTSVELGIEKGSFPNWHLSIFNEKNQNIQRRNAALTTVAPTGSISMLLDCSSGVEPFFALAYYKEVLSGQKLIYVNPHLKKELKRLGLEKDSIIQEIEKTGTCQHITEIPKETRDVFVTAMDISADAHIHMQAAFQREVDNSISKTINFTNEATREDVKNGYILAWKSGLKGCTVYRDGSRQEQVLNLNSTEEKAVVQEPVQTTLVQEEPVKSNFEEVTPPPVAQVRDHGTVEKKEPVTVSFNKKDVIKSKKCPECSCAIQVAEGCMLCLSCGYSACSV
jgi:ribonucleoside-diphosphate reductase alpha chain